MAKELKRRIVSELVDGFRGAKDFLLVDYSGLGGSTQVDLRASLRKEKLRVVVVKNTLSRIAFKELGVAGLDGVLQGPTALIHGECDPIKLCKSVLDWRDKNKLLKVRCGFVEGKVVSPPEVEKISRTGSKVQVVGTLVSLLQSPIWNLVATLEGILGGLGLTIDAIREKRAETA